MSIFKSLLVVALLVAVASAGGRSRKQRGRRVSQRGREFEEFSAGGDAGFAGPQVDTTGFEDPGFLGPAGDQTFGTFGGAGAGFDVAAPEQAESSAALGDALDAATEQKEIFAAPEDLSASEAAAVGENLLGELTDATAIAAEDPLAQELQPEVVAAQVEETHFDLRTHLQMATEIQAFLNQNAVSLSPEEVAQHRAELHNHLELALHFAMQNSVAIQQDKALEEGASPIEVVEIAPEIVAQGRYLRG